VKRSQTLRGEIFRQLPNARFVRNGRMREIGARRRFGRIVAASSAASQPSLRAIRNVAEAEAPARSWRS